MKVSTQYAATHLDDILSAADNGEEVRIDRPNKPGIRLVVEKSSVPPTPLNGRRHLFGAGKGLVNVPSESEWLAMKKELEADMVEGPLLPSDRT